MQGRDSAHRGAHSAGVTAGALAHKGAIIKADRVVIRDAGPLCWQRKNSMRSLTCSLTIAAMLAIAGTTSARAETLKEKQIQARQETELAKDVEHSNKTCGSSFSVKFDWTNLPAGALEKFSAEGYCDAALEAVRRVCADAPGKDAVKQSIKTMTCGFGRERAISLKDGSLHYTINFDSVNDADFVYAYLLNNL
jgi:hypothetical protein